MSICRPSRACSLRRIAPRTEVSASSFWGGSLPEVSGGSEMATADQAMPGPGTDAVGRRGPSLCGHDRLDLSGDALVHLDRDHVRPGRADRGLELDLPPVELQPARLLDRVDDVLRRDRAEQPAVLARSLRDREDGAGQERRVLLRAVGELLSRLLGRVHAPLGLGDRPRRGGLCELARQQEVAKVAGRHVDHVAALANVLHALEEDRLCHAGSLPVGHVRQEPQLASALDRDRELLLVPAAGARNAGRADLALLAHRAAQRAEVLVVDDLDLVAAELAWLAPAASRWTLLVTPARCLLPATCLCHACSLLPVRSQNGMSSSPALPAGVLAKSAVSAGTSDCGVK